MAVVQIFGKKKCFESGKARRFFQERRRPIQFINLAEKGMSRGELSAVMKSVRPEELIDIEGREYEKMNLKYIVHDIEEKLLENPLLFRTPVVRSGNRATVGYRPEIWKEWLQEK